MQAAARVSSAAASDAPDQAPRRWAGADTEEQHAERLSALEHAVGALHLEGAPHARDTSRGARSPSRAARSGGGGAQWASLHDSISSQPREGCSDKDVQRMIGRYDQHRTAELDV